MKITTNQTLAPNKPSTIPITEESTDSTVKILLKTAKSAGIKTKVVMVKNN